MSPRVALLASALAVGAACAFAATLATDASAEDHFVKEHFDLAVAPGAVTLTTKGEFHVNQDYPWKLVSGDVKLDKTKFVFSEKTATITGAPKGKATLRGAVCSKDECHRVEEEVTIQ
jgi:hypothetical protein